MPSLFAKRSLPQAPPSPSPIAHPKTSSSSILKRPMRNAASYLAALSQADAEARARNNASDDEPSVSALSLRSLRTDDTSYLTTVDDSDDADDVLDVPPYPPTSQQTFTTKHSEFGHCSNEAYRYTSSYKPGKASTSHVEEDPPYYILITTYLSYLILIVLGHFRDFVGKRIYSNAYRHLMPSNVSFLFNPFEVFGRVLSCVSIRDCGC